VLSEEIETTMRLIGVTSLDQLGPNYVNTKQLDVELPDEIDIPADQPKLKSKL
jgi:L-lactate dehydrogenase (cytochrome)